MTPLFRPDQMPPHDADAERALLSALFRGPAVAADVLDAVSAEALYADAHQKIYRAARGLHDAGKPVDLVLMADALRGRGWLEDVGGAAYLAAVWDADPTGAAWEYHAGIVREKSACRAILHAGTEALRDAAGGVIPSSEIIANLERAMVAANADAAGRAGPVPMAELVAEAVGRIDDRQNGRDRGGRVPTGLGELDDVLGGLRPGSLTVVAARPSVGKTSLALTALANAATAGIPGLLFSLEMTGLDIADRFLAMQAEVPLGEIVGSTGLTPASVKRLVDATANKPRILVDAAPGHTAASICGITRRAVRRHGVRVVCMDYLGLVSAERGAKRTDRRDLELGAMVKQFKRVGQECGVPVVLLAQLNREVEKRADGRPTLADLKDSGEIEADADVVILLKPEPFTPGSDTLVVTAIIAKNRQGPRCDVPLTYRRPFVRFETSGIPM